MQIKPLDIFKHCSTQLCSRYFHTEWRSLSLRAATLVQQGRLATMPHHKLPTARTLTAASEGRATERDAGEDHFKEDTTSSPLIHLNEISIRTRGCRTDDPLTRTARLLIAEAG